MKIIFIIAIVAAFAIAMFLFKKGNTSKIQEDKGTTTGIVVEVFNRGKLPFCKFEYSVNNKSYTKTQEIQKAYTNKVVNQTFTVLYEKSNPSNAIIQFK